MTTLVPVDATVTDHVRSSAERAPYQGRARAGISDRDAASARRFVEARAIVNRLIGDHDVVIARKAPCMIAPRKPACIRRDHVDVITRRRRLALTRIADQLAPTAPVIARDLAHAASKSDWRTCRRIARRIPQSFRELRDLAIELST